MSDLHRVLVQQPLSQLRCLLAWLDKAKAHAEARGFDPDTFLEVRLIADMFPLRRQIQAATDSAKFVGARCAGVTAPVHADDETTLAQLRSRIESVIAFLDTIEPAALQGADERVVRLGFLPEGKGARALDYALEMGLPNFQFHLTMAYALLRANGVDVGKRDYIGGMTLVDL